MPLRSSSHSPGRSYRHKPRYKMRPSRNYFTLFRYAGPVLAVLVLLAVGGAGLWYASRPPETLAEELMAPNLAMAGLETREELTARPLFFNMKAVPWVKAHWETWGRAFRQSAAGQVEDAVGRVADSPANQLPEALALSLDPATRAPQEWRELDRRWRFGAALLVGDPAEYRPLLVHLLKAPDWTLTRVDPVGVVFERKTVGAAPVRWTAADVLRLFEPGQPLGGLPASQQTQARVQVAHILLYLNEAELAEALLREALQGDAKSAPAWTELASLFATQGRWQEAVRAATKAVGCNERYLPAHYVRAEASLALEDYPAALEAARQLANTASTDARMLQLYAKVCHGARVYQEEANVLQRLINLVRGHQPVGGFQVYLGQAYASMGERGKAVAALEEGLRDGSLDPQEREFATAALARLRENEKAYEVPAEAPIGEAEMPMDGPAIVPNDVPTHEIVNPGSSSVLDGR